MSCFVCEEFYKRDVNPAMTLVPCGHIVCNPCILQWRKENNSCPQCRKPIQNVLINRGLMDLIEENKNDTHHPAAFNKNDKMTPSSSSSSARSQKKFASNLFSKRLTTKDRTKEIIHDKSEYVIYIIDNSKSMEYYNDGKIFKKNASSKIIKKSGVIRWIEASSKIQKIAKYNISRKICAAYYLLNPLKRRCNNNSWKTTECDVSDWKENIDFIKIDPYIDDNTMITQKYNILIENIMSRHNVRGDTPLDQITKYFGNNLSNFIDYKRFGDKAICYNIITDGEPNDKYKFEMELKYLANNYNIFLTINLCTDSDEIVDYYNDLDVKIGKELSGCDVIDDFEAEQKEVIAAGNTFFIYSQDIHICRMSGCYSIIADLMDETKLSIYHACKLCNELCDIQRSLNDNFPDFNDRENYIKYIKTMINSKPKVYDFKNKQFGTIIDVKKLNYMIWFNQSNDNQFEYIQKMIIYFITNYPRYTIIIIVLLYLLWLKY